MFDELSTRSIDCGFYDGFVIGNCCLSRFKLQVSIPPNTTAKVLLPTIPNAQITVDGQPAKLTKEADTAAVTVGAGAYTFEVK